MKRSNGSDILWKQGQGNAGEERTIVGHQTAINPSTRRGNEKEEISGNSTTTKGGRRKVRKKRQLSNKLHAPDLGYS